MPHRRCQKNVQYVIARAFATCSTLVVVLLDFLYWRHEVTVNEQLRQARLEKERALQSEERFVKIIVPTVQRTDKPYGLSPSVTIAQACLESNFGQSEFLKKCYNLFDVRGTDPNTSRELTASKFVNGHWETVTGRFQAYNSYEESVQTHAWLFVNRTSWNKSQCQYVSATKDYVGQTQILGTDGYVTDPGYAKKLIGLIKELNLAQHD